MPTKAHTMAGGPIGDVVDLGAFVSNLQITARAACWVRAVPRLESASAPTAPLATPLASAGGESTDGWVPMLANDVWNAPSLNPEAKALYREIEVWELAAGGLICEGN